MIYGKWYILTNDIARRKIFPTDLKLVPNIGWLKIENSGTRGKIDDVNIQLVIGLKQISFIVVEVVDIINVIDIINIVDIVDVVDAVDVIDIWIGVCIVAFFV